ncbi:MAG: N-formylglutamate amidohydrolase [Rhodospirillaceae bacterium]
MSSPVVSSSSPAHLSPLLSEADPPAISVLRPEATTPLLLVCDHAAYRVPVGLGDLGLPASELQRHIGWDIGAQAMTEVLSEHFDASAVSASYSRLVIDPNRAPGDPSAIPQESDGTAIPANADLSEEAAEARTEALFWPYHHEISTRLAHLRRVSGKPPAILGVHSCTDWMDGAWRPWEIGILYAHDDRLARPFIDVLRRQNPDLTIGDNQPYSGKEVGYTVNTHGEAAGLPYAGIEVRQDLIGDADGAAKWAKILARALDVVLAEETLYRVEMR